MRAAVLVLVAVLVAATAAVADDEADLDRARDLLDGPKREEAVATMRRLIARVEKAPKDAAAWSRAGRARWFLGEEVEAVAALERAVALAPAAAEHALWLGIVTSESDPEKALRALDTAVRLDSKSAEARYRRGRVHEARKDANAALADFAKAVELGPDDAFYRYRLGVALQEADRAEEAVPHYERSLALEPGFVNAGFNLGLLQYLAKRYEKALAAWKGVAEHAPQDFRLHAKVVQALYALGRYDEAAPWREKVLRIHETTEDEETKKEREFCFDQFEVGGDRVFAYEPLPGKKGRFGYVYVFRVVHDGKEGRTVNLEPNALTKELGGPAFFLGADEGDEHTTYARSWKSMPPYPELKAAVVAAVLRELSVSVSSRRGR